MIFKKLSDFAEKLHSEEFDCAEFIFGVILTQKKIVTPLGGFDPKTSLFGWKMTFWAYIFKTAHQILMIFSQMLDIIALNDLVSVLCAKKF